MKGNWLESEGASGPAPKNEELGTLAPHDKAKLKR